MKQTPLNILLGALAPWLAVIAWAVAHIRPQYKVALAKETPRVGSLILARDPRTGDIWWWPFYWKVTRFLWVIILPCWVANTSESRMVSLPLTYISIVLSIGVFLGLPCAKALEAQGK